MIGGGPGAFIGPVHRIAAELDREIELVAGVFSSDAARSSAGGEAYRIDPARAYPSLDAMFAGEQARDDGIDFVSIVSPNHHHLPAARAALAAGIPVMSDKPPTATLDEAHELAGLVVAAALPFGVTHTYSGYPLVREARARVAAGAIGRCARWWSNIRRAGLRVRPWASRPNGGSILPSRAGRCIGDIGVHAFQLAEFITGQRMSELLADLAQWSRAVRSTMIAPCCCGLPMAHAAYCSPARSRSASSTACASGSMATRAGWSGTRNGPTR